MTGPVRLHLVEPQPLLRGRLSVAFEQLGFAVSSGEPTGAVPEGALLLINIDGPDDDWAIGAELLVQDHAPRAVVSSSSERRLADDAWVDAFARQLRPFQPQSVRFPSGSPDSAVVASAQGLDRVSPDVQPVDAGPSAVASAGPPTEQELQAVDDSLESVLVGSYAEAIAALVPLWSELGERDRTAEVRQMLERFAAELQFP